MGEFHRKLAQPSVPPQGKQPPSRGIKLIQLHPLPYCRSFAHQGGGLGLKKFQEALSIRPFLAVLPCALLVLPSLPSFRFLPVHFSSALAACAIFQRSLLFPFLFFFFSQIGRQLLGQLFLSLSFFRFLTTLARDLTDPIETTRPVAPRRMMNREIV